MRKTASTLQLVLSLTAMLLMCMIASSCALSGFLQMSESGLDRTQPFLWGIGIAFSGLLLLPSAYYAYLRLTDRAGQDEEKHSLPMQGWLPLILLVGVLPLGLLLGYLVSQNQSISWLLLPPLHLVVVSIPILWLTGMALKRLPLGSAQRAWGVFGAGLVLGPALILITEILALFAFVVSISVGIASQPGMADQILALSQRLQVAPGDPETIFRILEPYLTQPLVILGVLAFVAVLVPLIEETLKPIGVWLLVGRALTPAEGFAAGVLSGAGYALFENLFLATGDSSWVTVAIARIGTGALHILATGLTGWGLAKAWTEKRFLNLGAAFMAAVGLHALWNGLTVMTIFAGLPEPLGAAVPGWARLIGRVAPAFLGFLFLFSFSSLFIINRRLQQETQKEAAIPVREKELANDLSSDRAPVLVDEFDPLRTPNPEEDEV